jgi:hypothetical protein
MFLLAAEPASSSRFACDQPKIVAHLELLAYPWCRFGYGDTTEKISGAIRTQFGSEKEAEAFFGKVTVKTRIVQIVFAASSGTPNGIICSDTAFESRRNFLARSASRDRSHTGTPQRRSPALFGLSSEVKKKLKRSSARSRLRSHELPIRDFILQNLLNRDLAEERFSFFFTSELSPNKQLKMGNDFRLITCEPATRCRFCSQKEHCSWDCDLSMVPVCRFVP